MTASAGKKQSGLMLAAPTEQAESDLVAARAAVHFGVYRVDETHVSAMRWLGGEWRWRLLGSKGETLALSCQYPTSDACLAAAHVLRVCAGAAEIIIVPGPKK